MALAVFFESSAEALNYWYGIADNQGCRHGFAFQNCVNYSGNHNDIDMAPAFDTCLGQVSMSAAEKAIIDFKDGMSFEKACKANEVSQEKVEELLRCEILKFSNSIKETVSPKTYENRELLMRLKVA